MLLKNQNKNMTKNKVKIWDQTSESEAESFSLHGPMLRKLRL